ncbi:protein mpv17 [Plakobranchus ocellatus]|uniref:Mitochondrial inner membrane protein Mpv17 n=1 Tax=Plakobranchus ocellatus TaxID=259542 RepID=A0AAV3YJQ4_9GAST|nr:protein mpv17 [Plakobranchus ocellatus]
MAVTWGRYLRLLEKFPLATMAGTTGVLMATGDCVSQLAIERKTLQEYDLVRSGRFAVLGFCVMGPAMRGWYWTLDKLYTGSKMAALKMMATDQILMAPTFVGTFISLMAVLRGENLEGVKGKLKRDWLVVLINGYKIWPAAQFINFYFMPLRHRVLFVNFVALGWNTYLAWVTEKK